MKLEQYLSGIPEHRKARFNAIFAFIKTLYPGAEITMKYKMPTFSRGAGWVALGNQKNYISLYTCSAEHLVQFKAKYPYIKTGKGCINFRDADEIPFAELQSVISNALDSGHGLK